jgi:hypothetical protein
MTLKFHLELKCAEKADLIKYRIDIRHAFARQHDWVSKSVAIMDTIIIW